MQLDLQLERSMRHKRRYFSGSTYV